jgi:hypothetical protein
MLCNAMPWSFFVVRFHCRSLYGLGNRVWDYGLDVKFFVAGLKIIFKPGGCLKLRFRPGGPSYL